MYKDSVNTKRNNSLTYSSVIKEYINNWWQQDKRLILASFFIGLTVTFLICFLGYRGTVYANSISSNISDEVLRFHVLANSNSQQDQELKLLIKDQVILSLEDELRNSNSREETITHISNNLAEIEELAREIIAENGYNYEVSAVLTNSTFPTKTYGDITLPSGDYDALQINIGDATGENWWCCMFPPLCFVDVTTSSADSVIKYKMSEILSDEAYLLVTETEEPTVNFKFKIVELMQSDKSDKIYSLSN